MATKIFIDEDYLTCRGDVSGEVYYRPSWPDQGVLVSVSDGTILLWQYEETWGVHIIHRGLLLDQIVMEAPAPCVSFAAGVTSVYVSVDWEHVGP